MDQIKDWTFMSCAVTCLAACIYMSLGLRTNHRDRALLMLTAAFGFKFVSLTVAAPDVAAVADRLTGIPDLTALVVHLFGGVGCSTGILAALSYWTCPAEQARRRVKCWLVLAALMAGVLISLWLAARPAVSNRSGNYLLDNMQLPQVAVYLVLYTVAFAAGLLGILVICVRYARVAPGVWLRRGLRITAIGAAVYLLYCVHRLICVTALHLRVELPDLEFITPVCIGVGVPLMAVGLTLPSWGAKLTAASAWLHDYRSYQALYPLWRELYDQVPSIALDPPRSRIADVLRFREVGYHLCRRVIEINDGRLALGAPTAALQAQAPARGSSGLAGEVEQLVQMSRRTRAA